MLEITLSLDSEPTIPLLAEHQQAEFACAVGRGVRLALSIDGQPIEPFLRPGEQIWRWRWNPGPAVGLHRITLEHSMADGAVERADWPLRVAPRKIDQERYEALMEDLERTTYGLAATLAGASAEGAVLDRDVPWHQSPAEEYYALFEDRLDLFIQAVQRIARRPREQLRGDYEQLPLGQATELNAAAIANLARGQFDSAPPEIAAKLQDALRPGGGVLPREIAAARARPTTDIYEHRLLKHVVSILARHARLIGALAARAAARLAANEAYAGTPNGRRLRAEQISAGCTAAVRQLRELRELPFLAEVQPLPAFRGATPLLQRDPAYREVYRMWQALRQRPILAFDSPLFALPIADLPQLYESWCALQVARALLDLGGTVSAQRLVEPRRAADDEALEYLVELSTRAPLLVIEQSQRTLTLRYQPRYRPLATGRRPPTTEVVQQSSVVGRRSPSALGSLDRHTRVPDLAIEIRDANGVRALLLDAKYRLDADGQGVPEDALADAYTYFGAIGAAGQRATIGALLLYPGRGAPERYASGVGSIPLLPDRREFLQQALAAWLA